MCVCLFILFLSNVINLSHPFSTYSTTRMDTSSALWASPPHTCPLITASPCGSLGTCSSESTTPSTTAPTTVSAYYLHSTGTRLRFSPRLFFYCLSPVTFLIPSIFTLQFCCVSRLHFVRVLIC